MINRLSCFAGLALALAMVGAAACEMPPPARVDIDANSYYSDAHHSVIDPVLQAKNIANVKPIEDFLARVARDASGRDPGCALRWLASWGEQQAMLGKLSSEQAYYVRKWTLSGLALSYARVQAQATPAQRAVIESWLRRLADATIAHSDAFRGTRNNHYYWEGLAVTAVGGVTGDARYLAWGRKVFAFAMSQVADDGALPAEMGRAGKALHYHLFAATPLAMMASILNLHDARLDKLVSFTMAAAADPSGLARVTGVAQEPERSDQLAVIYNRHAGRPAPGGQGLWQARLGGALDVANPLEHLQ
ncbi:alginate lyase [Duganella sp. FT80W]|uniref:Alginate lyase n=1 Tax=Duganella guangzhouensis TaxID=2666084 RepID=A0A6I2LAA3_9BURK|nr:alginate lyase family protein [Duganella guangzhouensis]MRW93754.1 alginate lyase [Duganella guangzhouensis]